MDTGKMRDIIEVLESVKSQDSMGKRTEEYKVIQDNMRGNFRSISGKEMLFSGVQFTLKTGELLTRYFPKASNSQFIRINRSELFEVITANHNDERTSTLWTIRAKGK